MKLMTFFIPMALVWGFSQTAQAESIISRDLSQSSLNRSNCEEPGTIVANWSIATSTASLSYNIRLEARDHANATNPCPIGAGSSNVENIDSVDVTNLSSQVDVTFSISTNDIFESDACGDVGAREARTFCLYVRDQTNIDVASDGFSISYDTVLPEALEVGDIQPGDEKIQFQVSGGDPNGNKTLTYIVAYRSCDSEASDDTASTLTDAGFTSSDAGMMLLSDGGQIAIGGVFSPDAGGTFANADAGAVNFTPDAGSHTSAGSDAGATASAGFPMTDARDGGTDQTASLCGAEGDFLTMSTLSSTITISDLNNDEQYEFKVYAEDDFDNVGPYSDLYTSTPLNEVSVMDMYDGTPNPWGFNCQQSQHLPLPLLALAAFLSLLRVRKNNRLPKVPLLIVLSIFVALPVQADVGQTSFSMSGGPYLPAIDSETVDGESIFPIYDCFFDNETLGLMQLDFGYRVLDGFGNIQLGLGLGYAQARGTAQTADILTTGQCGEKSSGSVALHLVELRPYAAYYLDAILLEWGIPIVPYAKLGVASFLYGWTHDGEQDRSGEADDNYATGVRPAIDSSAGFLLALDWLEPSVTRRARASGTYENAYALLEVAYVSTTEPGVPGLVLSATDLYFDTQQPLMVRFGIMVEYP
ncbi:MAG: hypothetical protein CMH56_04270 [Myxococcales bacterium]|nr:hypothetical protein [Myxococcales bacterium]|tara:strand:- start:164 stop:2092 length:1929 start_codon:yes stop_codon:yes gene_type:complete